MEFHLDELATFEIRTEDRDCLGILLLVVCLWYVVWDVVEMGGAEEGVWRGGRRGRGRRGRRGGVCMYVHFCVCMYLCLFVCLFV